MASIAPELMNFLTARFTYPGLLYENRPACFLAKNRQILAILTRFWQKMTGFYQFFKNQYYAVSFFLLSYNHAFLLIQYVTLL
jgi:hypothetical protein